MDIQLIPSPDSIPVNWWWFQVLLIFTFLIHIILMNFILGGSLMASWDILRNKMPGRDKKSIPTLIALTVNFGVPPLLFVQVLYGHFFYSSSVILALPWILVIPALILGYYAAYVFVYRYDRNPSLARISLLVSSLILLFIAFIYVNNNTLSINPARWSLYFGGQDGVNLNFGEPTLWPRFLHYVIGAIAVAGIGKALWFRFSRNDDEHRIKGINQGIRVFTMATLLQVLIGIWFLLALPDTVMHSLMGGNTLNTVFFILGLILALSVIVFSFRRQLTATSINLVLLLSIMIIIRDAVRREYLRSYFSPADLDVTSKPGSLILFLLVFIIGLLAIYYMVKLILKPQK